jgi:transcriptional regulator with PAS, ATPase and Fis domain
MEKLHIKGVLEKCAGDKYKASEVLGISLSSLYRKLTKADNVA